MNFLWSASSRWHLSTYDVKWSKIQLLLTCLMRNCFKSTDLEEKSVGTRLNKYLSGSTEIWEFKIWVTFIASSWLLAGIRTSNRQVMSLKLNLASKNVAVSTFRGSTIEPKFQKDSRPPGWDFNRCESIIVVQSIFEFSMNKARHEFKLTQDTFFSKQMRLFFFV